ncbi:MAG TPA: thiamine phosphate synthase [Vicinamibacterales bacterium]|nr:thiamine phosphate synthase [Vicinamibacterales bacterium]
MNLRLSSDFPRLYAIVDVDIARRAGWPARELTRAYLAGGARLLQLRAKSMQSGEFLDLASAVAEDVKAADGQLIVNDRADIALLSGAEGVHVGQDDLAPDDVRRVVGADFVVGYSTHTEAQIASALREPITYLAVGPVFWTTTKETGHERVGLSLMAAARRATAESGRAVVAIGGITLHTARSVIEAGASSVAVIADLLEGNPEARVREYLAALA